ncbi:MAG: alpha/beta hydrolase [Alphaproteobacteria bacterium]|nr:alpha/beta hydrolase [Alphaproteobacteria bacterium]MDX5369360.1 alpha/beta hydrolase [Alphaproteobacteria bacterium]MDX5464041.1 alpha/beta hydrolase [Alphaproteobacteria bacterium]
MATTQYFQPLDRPRLAYSKRQATGAMERRAGVIFMGGFRSDMEGTKALFLDEWAGERGRSYLRFDYSGHGSSGGAFEDLCLGDWIADARDMVRMMTTGPQVVVGSSMGGWIALHAALALPHAVRGLVGIAAAPDFTEDLMWAEFSEDIRAQIMETGVYHEPSEYSDEPYAITRLLIEDGRKHLLLRAPIPLDIPVRLLQGMKDADVPWERALKLAGAIAHDDVRVTLLKGGDHRLSTPEDLDLLAATLDEVCAAVDARHGG